VEDLKGMDRIKIEHISEIADIMYDIVSVKNIGAMFVGKYEDAADVIKYLLTYDDTLVSNITINDFEIYGYDKEFYVSLDTEKMVWCEKAYCEENSDYLMTEEPFVLVADDCNSAVLKKIISNNILEVSFEDEEECDCNCSCCGCNDNHEVITRVAKDKDGKMKGFEKSWTTNDGNYNYETTYSFYSSNENMLKEMLENFNIKF